MSIAVPEPATSWQPLQGAGRNLVFPAAPGLYWIRRSDTGEVVYIGQTGRNLRGRLGSLAGAFRDQMPYNDPHTAGPAIWALRHRDACDFEAAVMPTAVDVQQRKAFECVAIWAHRDVVGCSPAINFGGMPDGYLKSSQNNRRLVEQGKRFRGGPDPNRMPTTPSTCCRPGLAEAPISLAWGDLNWSPWSPLDEARPSEVGLYRIRRRQADDLVYIGQGRVGSRLRSHRAKSRTGGHRQAVHFAGDLLVSWVALDVPARTLLEVENDLVAAYSVQLGRPPAAQFLG